MTIKDQILNFMPGQAPMKAIEIADALGLKAPSVRRALGQLKAAGEIVHDEAAKTYAAPPSMHMDLDEVIAAQEVEPEPTPEDIARGIAWAMDCMQDAKDGMINAYGEINRSRVFEYALSLDDYLSLMDDNRGENYDEAQSLAETEALHQWLGRRVMFNGPEQTPEPTPEPQPAPEPATQPQMGELDQAPEKTITLIDGTPVTMFRLCDFPIYPRTPSQRGEKRRAARESRKPRACLPHSPYFPGFEAACAASLTSVHALGVM